MNRTLIQQLEEPPDFGEAVSADRVSEELQGCRFLANQPILLRCNHLPMHPSAKVLLATLVAALLSACDVNVPLSEGPQSLQQFKQTIVRIAHRTLRKIRLNFEASVRAFRSPAPVLAKPIAEFLEAIGVNVHIAYTWTAYADISLVQSKLSYLGVNNIRDNPWKFSDWSTTQTHFQQLASSGIKFDFVIPVYLPSHSVNLAEFMSMVDAFVQTYPGSVIAIEGPNEVNFTPADYGGGTGYANQAALQKALYAAVRTDPNLVGIPVYNLSLGSTHAGLFAELGNLSAAADYANAHAYVANWMTPADGLNFLLPFAQIAAPGLPEVITETGYITDPNHRYSGVNESVQAKFTLDTVLDANKEGIAKTYLYELLDQVSDPTNGNLEYHYGLFNTDGTPKLVATALHNLTTILADSDNAGSFTPASVSYAIPDLPVNGNQLLLEKSNGTFDLIVWAELPIWDSATQREIVVANKISTVTFAEKQKLVRVFDPLHGVAPVSLYRDVQSITIELSDHPIIIEIQTKSALERS